MATLAKQVRADGEPPVAAHALRARGVVQRFGGELALDLVDLEVRAGVGEIVALLGENGAGKSTLVKILTGALQPQDGIVEVDGDPARMRSPRDSASLGIGVVHQDYHLFPHRSVAENIFAATTTGARLGVLRVRAREARAHAMLQELGIDIDVRRRAGTLDAAERKLVEIVRALTKNPRYLFLDEPTAALEPRETDRLLDLMQRLAARGTGLVFVTHRLTEVLRVSDRAVVLRDGRNAGVLDREELDPRELVRLIVGQEVQGRGGPEHTPDDEVVLRLGGAQLRPGARPVSVTLRSGEVVGVVGLLGSGISELLGGVVGIRELPGTELDVEGRRVRVRKPAQAKRLGIGYVPEDRKRSGVLPRQSVAENLALASLHRSSSGGWVRRGELRRLAREARTRYDIRCRSVDQEVGTLSGGNQQKVLVGRWFQAGVKILVVDEPTHGVDVAAREEIHRHILEFTRNGGSVLVASSDLEEVRDLAHRILTVYSGEVTAEFDCQVNERPTRERLTHAMAGFGDTAGDSPSAPPSIEEAGR